MNDKILSELINDKIGTNASVEAQIGKYFDYYKGDHEILNREIKGEENGKPNNRQVYNWCELIIETNHSYLFYKPYSMDAATHTPEDKEKAVEEFMNDLDIVYFDNDEETITSSLGKTTGIAGKAVEILYVDELGNIKFMEVDPREVVFFAFAGEKYALRYYSDFEFVLKENTYEKVEFTKAVLYSKDQIVEFKSKDDKFLIEKTTTHFFGEVPVIEYRNKESIADEGQSDLRNVIDINNAYNMALANSLNNIEYSGNPYLVLKGFGFSDEQLQRMVDMRIIELPSDSDADVKYLNWDNNQDAINSFLDRTEKLLFVLSFTPMLFNENMGNVESGISLKLKFLGADLKSNQKEKSFIKSLRKRIKLIAKQLENKTGKNYFTDGIYRYVDITFNRNVPNNIKELTEVVANLAGVVSEETRLKLLPFVDNASDELEKRQEEEGMPISFDEPSDEEVVVNE